MEREPLVTVASVVAAVAAVLALLRSFGAPLTDDQQVAISGLTSVLAPLVVALLVRRKVTPVDRVPWTPTDPPAEQRGMAASELAMIVCAVCLVILVVLALPL